MDRSLPRERFLRSATRLRSSLRETDGRKPSLRISLFYPRSHNHHDLRNASQVLSVVRTHVLLLRRGKWGGGDAVMIIMIIVIIIRIIIMNIILIITLITMTNTMTSGVGSISPPGTLGESEPRHQPKTKYSFSSYNSCEFHNQMPSNHYY